MKKTILVVFIMVLAIPTFGLAQYNGGTDSSGIAIPQGSLLIEGKIVLEDYNGGTDATGMAIPASNVPRMPNAGFSAGPYSGGTDANGMAVPAFK